MSKDQNYSAGGHDPHREITVTPEPFGGQRAEDEYYGRGGTRAEYAWNDSGPESLAAAFNATVLFLRRHFWLLIAGAMLGLLLVPLAPRLAPSSYKSTATILFDANRVKLFQGREVVGDSALRSGPGLDGEIQIMLSSAMLQRVIDKLGLDQEPEFAAPKKSRVERYFGEEVARSLGKYREQTPEWIKNYRISLLRSGLTIQRGHKTFTVHITYQSGTPERAAQVANAIAEIYLQSQINEKRQLNKQAGTWLKARLERLRSRLEGAQKKVISFRQDNGLIDQDGKRIIERRIEQLNGELVKEQGRASEMRARHDRLSQIIKSYQKAKVKPAVPDVFKNPLVTKLRDKFLELDKREKEWSVRFGRNHKATAKLRKEMLSIQESLLDEYKRLAQSYESDIKIAVQRQREIKADMQDAGKQLLKAQKAIIKLSELDSDVQSQKKLYDSFLGRYSEAASQETLPVPKARIIEPATAPLGKNTSKTVKAALALLILGFGVGGGLAVLREVADRSFRRLDDVEHMLDAKLITVVPELTRREVRNEFKLWQGMIPQSDDERPVKRSLDLIWAGDLLPQSEYAASIRSLKLFLDQRMREAGCDVIGVSSPQPNEGASTVAAALAVTAAVSGSRVLLLDCDLRNPSLSAKLAPHAELGLLDVLLERASLEDVIWTDQSTGLSFLPVTSVHGARPDELLASPAMADLVEKAKRKFDRIIIDLPPLVPMVDVQMTRDLVNAYIGIVEWGRTNREVARQAFARSPGFQSKLAGLVLNRVDIKKLHLYDAETAQWFNKKQYSNYLFPHGTVG